MKLWYTKPATVWEETLPLGNGRIGAMIWGKHDSEIIGINEDTLWSGHYIEKNNPNALKSLSHVRDLIFSGHQGEAFEFINKNMLGKWCESYLQLGNINIDFNIGEVEDYCRELDLQSSVASVIYNYKNSKHRLEMFISYPDDIIALALTSDKMDLNFSVSWSSLLNHTVCIKDGILTLNGKAPSHVEPSYVRCENPIEYDGTGMDFTGKIKLCFTDGDCSFEQDKIVISNAGRCVFYINAKTSYKDITCNFPEKSYEELKEVHIKDYNNLFGRVSLNLGDDIDLPTDERLQRIIKGERDDALTALYFQYGRYLLISSSRAGSQSANLQGIWSWETRAPWSSNWTTNINAQMNYWPALNCNLAECLEPYFDLINDLTVEGAKTANINYGCRGFCVHHNVDIWHMSSPADNDARHSYWPMAGGWMAREMYERYLYTLDKDFLKNTAFHVIKKAAMFYCDWLVLHDNYYVTCPSTSPENIFRDKNNSIAAANYASAMDMTIIRETFHSFINCCDILDMKDSVADEIKEKLSKLAPYTKGRKGELLEFYEDFEMIELGHRHLSHLYGIYPSNILFDTEEHYNMAYNAFIDRLNNGSGHTGWSCAWIINLWARFGDGEQSYNFVNKILERVDTRLSRFDSQPHKH